MPTSAASARYPVRIVGTGSSAPTTIVTSAELAVRLGTSVDWMRDILGVDERRRAAPTETTSDFATEAGQRALAQAGLAVDDIDLLIVATTTPDRLAPSTAAIVQRKLGATNTYPAFDIAAACTGFLYGLAMGAAFIATGTYRTVLLVGADTLSRVTDWNDRDCVYFGDGAGAAVLVPSDPGYGVLAFDLRADGAQSELYTIPAGGAENPASRDTVGSGAHFARHDGKNILSFAVEAVPSTVRRVLDQAGVTLGDIGAVIPHQASMQTVRAIAGRLGIPLSKITTTLKHYGNTGAASLPMALDDCHRRNGLKRGDLVLFMGLGAGMTWGAAVLRWDA